MLGASQVKQLGENSDIAYLSYQGKLGVCARDLCLLRAWQERSDGSIVLVATSIESDDAVSTNKYLPALIEFGLMTMLMNLVVRDGDTLCSGVVARSGPNSIGISSLPTRPKTLHAQSYALYKTGITDPFMITLLLVLHSIVDDEPEAPDAMVTDGGATSSAVIVAVVSTGNLVAVKTETVNAYFAAMYDQFANVSIGMLGLGRSGDVAFERRDNSSHDHENSSATALLG